MKESIYAAIRGEYGKRVLPPVGTAYDEDHTVIVCPICNHKTLNNYDTTHICIVLDRTDLGCSGIYLLCDF